jgi:3-methyladenine DNA glycosylase AlkC
LAEFVAANGCNKKDLYTSLNALREMTKRFSAEDAIRYFINAFPEETLYFLKEGATSYNYHIRRLSSEGTRPKLPWGIGITTHYKEALPILDILFSDPTRYITRSVANHMNDISKIDPDLVVEKLALWKESGKQNIQEMNFICRHSLRTLVKKGYPEALELLGYPCHPKITIENFKLSTKKVPIGSYLEFSFEIYSLSDQNLMIDYIVHYRSKSGSTSPKVFKIKKTHVKKGERVVITKKQAFKPMTTKKLYPGEHYMELQINGKKLPLSSFVLVEPS